MSGDEQFTATPIGNGSVAFSTDVIELRVFDPTKGDSLWPSTRPGDVQFYLDGGERWDERDNWTPEEMRAAAAALTAAAELAERLQGRPERAPVSATECGSYVKYGGVYLARPCTRAYGHTGTCDPYWKKNR